MNKREYAVGRAYSILKVAAKLLLFTITLLLLWSCSDRDGYFYVGDRKQQHSIKVLFESLSTEQVTPERRFVINQQIINAFLTNDEFGKMNLFLTTYTNTHPEDPFNGYYLLLLAQNYHNEGAYPFAIHYYERILKNHQELLIRGEESIHRICLQNLIELVEEPEVRVGYYRELIERFGDEIDNAPTHYYLAKTYEELGEWELAMQAYKEYLKQPNTPIPGRPNAYKEVETLVALYQAPKKNWTVRDLNDLVDRIKWSIRTQNARVLDSLRTKVGFFTKSWEEEEPESDLELLDDLQQFFQQTVRYSQDLDIDSNYREAYLHTTGWSYRIRTWYLYFRKLDFPADPDIHGEWEWAGIFLGEKPY